MRTLGLLRRRLRVPMRGRVVIEILPPLADGSWWLVQCHRCREIVGEAVASQWEAERVADHHARAHTNHAIPAGNRRLRAWLTGRNHD